MLREAKSAYGVGRVCQWQDGSNNHANAAKERKDVSWAEVREVAESERGHRACVGRDDFDSDGNPIQSTRQITRILDDV